MKIFRLFVAFTLVCFGLSQRAQGVVPPPPGGYPNFTTAAGDHALQALTLGLGNTALGTFSMFSVTTGNFNTAVGAGALDLNTADSNTATGAAALLFNTTGTQNTANGTAALEFNDTGKFNDAVGASALFNNVSGFGNNAFGDSALFSNVIGVENTALGDVAVAFNDSDGMGLANNNTAVGGAAMFNNIDGFQNTVVGAGAGQNLVAGNSNTYVGQSVGSTIGDEINTIRIGDISSDGFGSAECFIGGIFNNLQPVNGTTIVQVTLDLTTDHLGFDFGPSQAPGSVRSVPSRGAPLNRGKPQVPGRPQQRQALNDKVEKLQAAVVQQAMFAVKQHRQIEALTAQLKEQAETFTAQLKEQATQIQKVSARIEASQPAPQLANNP